MSIDLDAIRQRAAAAAKGPWTVSARKFAGGVDGWELTIHSPSVDEENPDTPDDLAIIRYQAGGFQYPHADARADADFIAHAREDIPALLDALADLRAIADAAIHYANCDDTEAEVGEAWDALVHAVRVHECKAEAAR